MALSPPLPPPHGHVLHPHDDPYDPGQFFSIVSATSCLMLPASVEVIIRAAMTNDAILFIIEGYFDGVL